MKIEIFKLYGQTEERTIQPGKKLVGLRLKSISIENSQDIQFLLSDRGQHWLEKAVCPQFSNYKK